MAPLSPGSTVSLSAFAGSFCARPLAQMPGSLRTALFYLSSAHRASCFKCYPHTSKLTVTEFICPSLTFPQTPDSYVHLHLAVWQTNLTWPDQTDVICALGFSVRQLNSLSGQHQTLETSVNSPLLSWSVSSSPGNPPCTQDLLVYVFTVHPH